MARVVKRGSVVLVRYPFTDLSGVKARPAVILTPDHFLSRLDDVLCFFISSPLPGDLLPTDFILEPSHKSFHKTGLRDRSVFRSHKLALLHKLLVVRVLGASEKALHDALLARGHDVTRTPNAWMPVDASDEIQLLGATAQGRCISTYNVKHFPDLAKLHPQHGGIILAALKTNGR